MHLLTDAIIIWLPLASQNNIYYDDGADAEEKEEDQCPYSMPMNPVSWGDKACRAAQLSCPVGRNLKSGMSGFSVSVSPIYSVSLRLILTDGRRSQSVTIARK